MILRLGNHPSRWIGLLLVSVLPSMTGCGLGYAFRQGVHQIRLLSEKRPVQDVLADPSVDSRIKEGIRTVQNARAFGEDHIGLGSHEAYQSYIQIEGDFVTYLVSASPKDQLVSYRWRFPLFGSFPYKGYFKLDDARKEVRALNDRGYDTYLSGAVAFSSLGWFSDPLYSSMLLMDDIDLVYTILHEMVHGTVFFPDSVDFNEQLATFVGWQGTVAFMEKIYGADSPQARMARQILREEIRLGQFLNWAYDRMLCYYALPLQSDQKVRGRQQIFEAIGEELRQVLSEMGTTRFFPLEEIVWNNASLLALWRYRYDSGDLECLYTHLGSDLRSLMALMKAWREDELDPQRAMKQQLADWSLKNAS